MADVVRRFGVAFFTACGHRLTSVQRRALKDIVRCRTAALGGHVEVYQCGHEHVAYNSCRNRNCPKCLAHKSREWVDKKERDLLPVPYFHLVFTVPAPLTRLARVHPRAVYGAMFKAVSETMLKIARDERHLGAQIGFLAILHTWGQTLSLHPHIHCIVPGGGLSVDGQRWVACKKGFFLPVRVLSEVFRGKLIARLKRLRKQGKLERARDFDGLINDLYAHQWVVYAKRPFGGPKQVLRYLARYTHRVAISDHRLLAVDDDRVTFRFKNYRRGHENSSMALDGVEMLRRFVDHVLPGGFVRIRSYGFLANCQRRKQLAKIRSLIGSVPEEATESKADDDDGPASWLCPVCGRGDLLTRTQFDNVPSPWDTS